MLPGEAIHGEVIHDGDSSGGVAVVLYKHGSVVVRTLAAGEILYISDFTISSETGGDIFLCADGKVAGEYVWRGTLAANGWISVHLSQPFACAPGTGLTLFGIGTNVDSCIIEGFITQT